MWEGGGGEAGATTEEQAVRFLGGRGAGAAAATPSPNIKCCRQVGRIRGA